MTIEGRHDQTPPSGSSRARATITVRESHAEPYDETAGPALSILSIRETFEGDIQGDSIVRALQIRGQDGSAHMISLQRVKGSLNGRTGSFVLQGTETVEDKAIKASWFVVPGSGTDALSGLRGTGGFEGRVGEGSHGTLDYWFE
jgi:hypothetical protein